MRISTKVFVSFSLFLLLATTAQAQQSELPGTMSVGTIQDYGVVVIDATSFPGFTAYMVALCPASTTECKPERVTIVGWKPEADEPGWLIGLVKFQGEAVATEASVLRAKEKLDEALKAYKSGAFKKAVPGVSL